MEKECKVEEIILTPIQRGISSTTFTGRPQGMQLRGTLNLDTLDLDNNKYIVRVPEGTTSFNPSFYLGLFFPSYKKLKGIEGFKAKYEIIFNEEDIILKTLLEILLKDCEREAQNEYYGKTGLDSIF
jgi:hypothetical protein